MKSRLKWMLPVLLLPCIVYAHGISENNAGFVQAIVGPAVGPFMYLGAKHMITGYDHLLFLVGVIFFLRKPADIVLYVSLFTVGHSITLLMGVMGGLNVNAYLVDAVIGFSIVYKAFENMGGFNKIFHIQPDTKIAVVVFGLIHGFGLATKLQELTLSSKGLITNIFSFNIGVEIGQIVALGAILIFLVRWRQTAGFQQHVLIANALLMCCGFILVGHHLAGFIFRA